MFTGLITDVGSLRDLRGGVCSGMQLEIESGLRREDLATGASISCAGVCLTVTGSVDRVFTVDVSPETLEHTHIGSWVLGRRINLEPSLRAGDPLGGHFVTGHVDGLGEVRSIDSVGGGHDRWVIGCPADLMGMIAERGSIAVDGCSLTVTGVGSDWFSFNMIPQTRSATDCGEVKVGGLVHLEIDVLARYVSRWSTFSGKEG